MKEGGIFDVGRRERAPPGNGASVRGRFFLGLAGLLAAISAGCAQSGPLRPAADFDNLAMATPSRRPTPEPAYAPVVALLPTPLSAAPAEPPLNQGGAPSTPDPPSAPTPEAGPGAATLLDGTFPEAVLGCFQSALLTGSPGCYGELVRRSGPGPVFQVVMELIESGDIDADTDTHDLAHVVGRQTALVFGLNGEGFLKCPTEFNYGCQHGFFEQALAESASATKAASSICDDLFDSHPSKTAFYCYHGVGHGVMMASAYDLGVALDVCDSLGGSTASEGCWQGVFMENVNAVMRGESREGVFSDTEPLAPCNRVEERHKWQCYINHAGRLITPFDFSMADASEACLDASAGYIRACMESLGLMVSNPSWQRTLVGPGGGSGQVAVTLELCAQFPGDHRRNCIVGAVDNIMNFEGVVLDRAPRLCGASDEPYREACYRHIGIAIEVQISDLARRLALCRLVDDAYEETCLAGAGVRLIDGQPVALRRPAGTVFPQGTPVAIEQIGDRGGEGDVTGLPGGKDSTGGAAAVVRYADGGFSPETVSISVGQMVRWVNDGTELMWPASDVHPTHQEYPGFDARRPIGPGGSWSFTFEEEGSQGYHNHMNPTSTGAVIVEK